MFPLVSIEGGDNDAYRASRRPDCNLSKRHDDRRVGIKLRIEGRR